MKSIWKDNFDIFTPSGANQNVLGAITGCAKNFVLNLLLKNYTCYGSYELKFEPEYLS